jgi:hypothetical protein
MIDWLLLDGGFAALRNDLQLSRIKVNLVAKDEHVPEVERYIRTVKERVRCIWQTLPFQRLPKTMVVSMVGASIFWLNAIPSEGGVSRILSAQEIITGQSIDYHRHCQLSFGTYMQIAKEHDNRVELPRTSGAIALHPTGNAQGVWYF